LHAAVVQSTRAHARIISIDASEALRVKGVEGFVSADDIPGDQRLGAIVPDEYVFAREECVFFGQMIGLIVASTDSIANDAARLVHVEYEDLPFIQTIPEAIESNSFFEGKDREIERGDVKAALEASDVIVEGEVSTGPQEHLYIEPQTFLVVPDSDQVTVHVTSQHPAKMQDAVSKVLAIPKHRVVVKIARVGGAFGGKETRPMLTCAAVAVAALRFGAGVRLELPRGVDVSMTGMRHDFLLKYRLGANRDGTLQAYELLAFANGGATMDLTPAVIDRGCFSAENCYKIPHCRIFGRCCRTNRVPNTAFRGFGAPQTITAIETAMDHLACTLGKSPSAVRELNMLGTHVPSTLFAISGPLEKCSVRACWSTLMERGDITARVADVEAFNAANALRKRGLAIAPARALVGFEHRFMHQAGALIQIYLDGSVLVTHGGIEMGQGIHTKMAMIAASELGVDIEAVRTSETSTDKVANMMVTAAASGSDLNGWAVRDACAQLNRRLAPVRRGEKKLVCGCVHSLTHNRQSTRSFEPTHPMPRSCSSHKQHTKPMCRSVRLVHLAVCVWRARIHRFHYCTGAGLRQRVKWKWMC
jgi:xanthine dehydrogenase/oxidase